MNCFRSRPAPAAAALKDMIRRRTSFQSAASAMCRQGSGHIDQQEAVCAAVRSCLSAEQTPRSFAADTESPITPCRWRVRCAASSRWSPHPHSLRQILSTFQPLEQGIPDIPAPTSVPGGCRCRRRRPCGLFLAINVESRLCSVVELLHRAAVGRGIHHFHRLCRHADGAQLR